VGLIGELLQLILELAVDSRRLVDVARQHQLGGRVATQAHTGVIGFLQDDQDGVLVAPQLQPAGEDAGIARLAMGPNRDDTPAAQLTRTISALLGRGGGIRTPDLLLPKQERYRCATPRSADRVPLGSLRHMPVSQLLRAQDPAAPILVRDPLGGLFGVSRPS
jgi:hypothetical protein